MVEFITIQEHQDDHKLILSIFFQNKYILRLMIVVETYHVTTSLFFAFSRDLLVHSGPKRNTRNLTRKPLLLFLKSFDLSMRLNEVNYHLTPKSDLPCLIAILSSKWDKCTHAHQNLVKILFFCFFFNKSLIHWTLLDKSKLFVLESMLISCMRINMMLGQSHFALQFTPITDCVWVWLMGHWIPDFGNLTFSLTMPKRLRPHFLCISLVRPWPLSPLFRQFFLIAWICYYQ